MRADPSHEGAARAAMQAHMAFGDTSQAMRIYERLWAVLDEEFDVEPSEKTQALYVAIKQGQHAAPRAARRPTPAALEPELLAPIAIVVEPTSGAQLPRRVRLFRRDLPPRDDRGPVAVPRLAGDRRPGRWADAAGLPRL